MDLRKLDRLPVDLPDLSEQTKRRMSLSLAIIVIIPAAYATYVCYLEASYYQQIVNSLGSVNSGFDDAGRRLGFRFQENNGSRSNSGLRRLELSRQASTWWSGMLLSGAATMWSLYRLSVAFKSLWRGW